MAVEGDLGRSFIEVHDWPKAEAHTQRALEIADSLHDEQAEQAQCLYKPNLGLVYANTGHMEQARQLAAEVLRVAEHLGDYHILGRQHVNLASFLFHELRLNDSLRHARQALAYAELSGDTELRAWAQYMLGKAFRPAHLLTGRREYAADAERHLQEAVELAQSCGNPFLEVEPESQLARLYEKRHQPAEAVIHYRRVMELLEKVRSGLGYEEFQLSYFRSFQPSYERITEFLLRQYQFDQAFLTAEKFRSRLLLALLGQGLANTRSWLTAQQQALTEILNIYGREVMLQCFADGMRGRSRGVTVGLRGRDTDPITSDPPPVHEARQRFLRLYESQRLYRTSWQPQHFPPVVSFAKAQRLLGQDEALLAYVVTAQSVVIFVATDQARHFQHLAYPREQIATDVHELCAAMSALQDQLLEDSTYQEWRMRGPSDPWPAAIKQPMARLHRNLEKIYALLIAPVLAVVDQKPHWVIVPHGPLHRVPWAALRGAGHYLVEQHSVSLLPSASVGEALNAPEPGTVGEAVFFADPDPDDPTLRLLAAPLEVQAGYEVFRAGPLPFIGPCATKREFLARAPMARLLHLACHHVFDASAPLLSFLKLAGSQGTDSLYAFEVAEGNLLAELVSVSGCQSARSHIATGDEQYGMVRAFLAAGARSVVSTLWCIEDESAAAFFICFYKRACKDGLGKALALAQRHLLTDSRYTLPYFWAPYVLSGQWSTPLTFAMSYAQTNSAPGADLSQ